MKQKKINVLKKVKIVATILLSILVISLFTEIFVVGKMVNDGVLYQNKNNDTKGNSIKQLAEWGYDREAFHCMKTQIFIDGNKRASIIFANHFMIQRGLGLLVVPESIVPEFKALLVAYYEGRDEAAIKQFLKEKCWRQF